VVSYYVAVDENEAAKEGRLPDQYLNETGTRVNKAHIQHCFDYIRQALMCAADTNLEVLDHETHVTNGWGRKKQCRNFDDVFAWAEKWANSTDVGIITLPEGK
jgi:hypothetical protein